MIRDLLEHTRQYLDENREIYHPYIAKFFLGCPRFHCIEEVTDKEGNKTTKKRSLHDKFLKHTKPRREQKEIEEMVKDIEECRTLARYASADEDCMGAVKYGIIREKKTTGGNLLLVGSRKRNEKK